MDEEKRGVGREQENEQQYTNEPASPAEDGGTAAAHSAAETAQNPEASGAGEETAPAGESGAAPSGAAKAEDAKAARAAYIKHEILDWAKSIAIALIAVFLIRSLLFNVVRVDGQSMETTLHNGERLFVTVADVRFGEPQRGTVVICHYPNRGWTYFVKRLVAVPGDQVKREKGVTYVIYTDENGNTVEEPLDPKYYNPYSSDDYEAYTLGENEYFVVGDNRYNSHDSQDWNQPSYMGTVGPISKSMIAGRVRQVFWPFSAFRSVE
ncbi:MAG: signal peptidase I [Clostridia bacterium]|nr:signal peptidase I [Clostridia bacterium]